MGARALLAVAVLALPALAGCLVTEDEAETTTVPTLGDAAWATYAYTLAEGWEGADREREVTFRFRAAEVPGVDGRPMQARVLDVEVRPETPDGESSLAFAAGRDARFALGSCNEPVWGMLDDEFVWVGYNAPGQSAFKWLPPFATLAGRRLDGEPMVWRQPAGNLSVHLLGDAVRAIWSPADGNPYAQQFWLLQYGRGSPWPDRIDVLEGQMRLVRWEDTGKPMHGCLAPGAPGHSPRIPVTARATQDEPPFRTSLRQAILLAEALPETRDYLGRHPDAYIRTWNYTEPFGFSPLSPTGRMEPEWRLGFAAAGATEGLAVRCVGRPFLDGVVDEPPVQHCTATPHGFDAAQGPPPQEMTAYDAMLEAYETWFGNPACGLEVDLADLADTGLGCVVSGPSASGIQGLYQYATIDAGTGFLRQVGGHGLWDRV